MRSTAPSRPWSENIVKPKRKVLIIGTADTKADELRFMRECIEAEGAGAAIMDVGVLGQPPFPPDIPRSEVAAASGVTIDEIAALGDENLAMTKMAEGAVQVTLERYRRGEVHGVLALGGTMGTDLALDVTAALPLGLPKMIVTTVAFSHLIAPERLAPDLMMILWAGGLYGLNSICKSILSQAAGAVLGACSAVIPVGQERPRVAISSLGKSCVDYMVRLTPALIERGYEPVVFHSTGMGGRAMEALIERGEFVAVFDFLVQEISNHVHGSVVTAGASRMEAAGRRGVPQLIAPGAADMIDVQSWQELPASLAGRAYHAHNRLIGSVNTTIEERRAMARALSDKLSRAQGPTAFLLPRQGIHAWDRAGQPMHDPEGLTAFAAELRASMPANVQLHDLDLHINDPQFTATALAVFDRWVEQGHIPRGTRAGQ
jgi:uncharacterized protein (UPF0261 family)